MDEKKKQQRRREEQERARGRKREKQQCIAPLGGGRVAEQRRGWQLIG